MMLVFATIWQTLATQSGQNVVAVVVGFLGFTNTLALIAIAWNGGGKIAEMNTTLRQLAGDVRDLLGAEKERLLREGELEQRVKQLEITISNQ